MAAGDTLGIAASRWWSAGPAICGRRARSNTPVSRAARGDTMRDLTVAGAVVAEEVVAARPEEARHPAPQVLRDQAHVYLVGVDERG
jgi:hypothetical protein